MKMKRVCRLGFIIVMLTTPMLIGQARNQDNDALMKKAKELSESREKLAKEELALLDKQLVAARQQLATLKKAKEDDAAVAAFAALVQLKAAEIERKRAAENAKVALQGASLVANDGQFLGKVLPSYDAESIFCSYGSHGSTYSATSIWCTYGKYGASYQQLSPFCSYSQTPPD